MVDRTDTRDLDLFLELNKEYENKPLVTAPRVLGAQPLIETSRRRATQLDKKHGLKGKRVLEVGCGRGHLSHVLATEFGCSVVGVDIADYDAWPELQTPGLELLRHDITRDDNNGFGRFDLIVSYSVWEHMDHPFAGLRAARDLLEEEGHFLLYANLYRGPKASHRYREVFFPWPHLLFTDKVFEEFYESLGMGPRRPAWVNKLTFAHYEQYFRRLDLDVDDLRFTGADFDEPFYERFAETLSRYPKFDLSHDFMNVTLRRKPNGSSEDDSVEEVAGSEVVDGASLDQGDLRSRIEAMERSTSWRVTAPLRAMGRFRNKRG